MGIIVTCCCGKILEAPAESAGRHGRCSECRRLVFVPRETEKAHVIYTGNNFQLIEAAIIQALCQLEIQPREAMMDEADKWAKAWQLPSERKPHSSGLELIAGMVSSCIQRDATVGMDRVSIHRMKAEPMLRVAVIRENRQLLHIVARIGEDQYLCWHHRDAEDEEVENAKQRTAVLQSLSAGVHCDRCDYNMGFVRLVGRIGLAPIVGYRCTVCNKILCTKCHGKFEKGCPECRASHNKLQVLAAKLPVKA